MFYWSILISGIYFLPLIVLFLAKKLTSDSYFVSTKQTFQKSKWLFLGILIIFLLLAIFKKDILFFDEMGNFWLHFLGGGFTSTVIFLFLVDNIKIKLSWIAKAILLFPIVSSLGVLNELLEYALDTILRLQFALGRTDTWRDLTANTLGAYTLLIIVFLSLLVFHKFTEKPKN